MNAPNDVPRSRLTGVPGWLTEAEELLLKEYAEACPPDHWIINIGVEYGRSLAVLAKYGLGLVLGIDVKILPAVDPNMTQAGLGKRYALLEQDSARVAWNGAPVFLVFVDGDHSINGVKQDIDQWANRVAVGGIIAFHDCACATNRQPHPSHYDVTHAIARWQGVDGQHWRLDRMIDSLMAFQRVE